MKRRQKSVDISHLASLSNKMAKTISYEKFGKEGMFWLVDRDDWNDEPCTKVRIYDSCSWNKKEDMWIVATRKVDVDTIAIPPYWVIRMQIFHPDQTLEWCIQNDTS